MQLKPFGLSKFHHETRQYRWNGVWSQGKKRTKYQKNTYPKSNLAGDFLAANARSNSTGDDGRAWFYEVHSRPDNWTRGAFTFDGNDSDRRHSSCNRPLLRANRDRNVEHYCASSCFIGRLFSPMDFGHWTNDWVDNERKLKTKYQVESNFIRSTRKPKHTSTKRMNRRETDMTNAQTSIWNPTYLFRT